MNGTGFVLIANGKAHRQIWYYQIQMVNGNVQIAIVKT